MSQTQLLDITGEACPMTLVRVRMALDELAPGGVLQIHMSGGEPVASIPRTLREEGHQILAVQPVDGAFLVTVRKKG